MKTYFIVGTDTDCGKTYVTCQLVNYLKKHHQRVTALKPVASGCTLEKGALVSEDEMLLTQSQNTNTEVGLFRFKEPVSPHIAAAKEGVTISLDAIAAFCDDRSDDYVLIEGAGGLMVPLNHSETWLDFLMKTKMDVIIVVGMRLGCINHALLTCSVLRANHIKVVGWVANCLDKTMLCLDENIATLTEKMNCPLLSIVPYKGTLHESFAFPSIL